MIKSLDNRLADTGIKFFSRMTSLSTHEIKNALAIINENAGLLEDLSSIPQQSLPRFMERINRMSRQLAGQVKRSDRIVRNLNRFSHSMDQHESIENLDKELDFILKLVSRFIDMQQVDIKVAPPEKPVRILTCPFYLYQILWQAVEYTCLTAKKSKKVFVSFNHEPEISIWFSPGDGDDIKQDNALRSDEDQLLAQVLGLEIDRSQKPNSFGFLWPKKV